MTNFSNKIFQKHTGQKNTLSSEKASQTFKFHIHFLQEEESLDNREGKGFQALPVQFLSQNKAQQNKNKNNNKKGNVPAFTLHYSDT